MRRRTDQFIVDLQAIRAEFDTRVEGASSSLTERERRDATDHFRQWDNFGNWGNFANFYDFN